MAQLEAGVEYPVRIRRRIREPRFAFNDGNGRSIMYFDRQLARIEDRTGGIWREAYNGKLL
jgi:hypothetical protein